MTADFSNLSPVGSDPAQFHGLIGVTLEGDPRLLDPSVLGGGGGDSGTVTSVGLSVPTGLAVSGSPVTTSGTIALTFAPGYGIPTTVRQSEWDTAFGWGNHAVAGYLLSSTAATTYQPLDGDLTAIGALAGTTGLLRKTAANTWSLDFDPVYVGGVAYFNRPTKPTERSAGVPLVIGDRWYNTSDGTEWFWNGTYWLTQELYGATFALAGAWGAAGTRLAAKAFTIDDTWSGVFFEQYSVHLLNQFATPWDASNYSTFTVECTSLGGGAVNLLSFTENNRTTTGSSSVKIIKDIGFFRTLATSGSGGLAGIRDIQVTTVKVGSGSTVFAQEFITYRGVAP